MLHFRLTRIVTGLAGLGLVVAGCAGPTGRSPQDGPHDIRLGSDGESIDAKVPPNATLEMLLRGNQLTAEATNSVLQAVSSVFNPKQLRANQTYRITRTLDGLFREFRYEIDADRLLRVIAKPAGSDAPGFSAEVIRIPKEYELTALEGEIGRGQSLIGVLEAAGENVQLALEMAAIFGGEVDFNSDIQPGDRYELLFERATRYGEFAGYGEMKAAVFVNAGRRLTAVRTTDADGNAVWYDENGRSLKRQFLKSPLPFDPRITSRFSMNRLHPVLGTYRAHLGVDYGAPYGTAVLSVADGVVDFAGDSGEAGRMVRIRHTGGYQTAYLHLSAFGPGIRPGVRVEQKQIIGRVGASGTVTGPHLDYRILRNGRYVDPLGELKRMPKGEPLEPSQLPAFLTLRDEVMTQLREKLASPAAHQPAPESVRK
jgi:murein DD-endopeptidase MepM/ murein hydrolase activator NlpD